MNNMRTPTDLQSIDHLKDEQHYQEIEGAVTRETFRQLQKWGEQNHPDFSPFLDKIHPAFRTHYYGLDSEDHAKESCEDAFINGTGSYAHIFVEEVCEAIGAEDEAALMAELTQVAAVAINWMRCIKRRQDKRNEVQADVD